MDYITFCTDCIVPTQTVHCYPNKNLWVTKDIKDLLNDTKRAFRAGNREGVQMTQGLLRVKIREATDNYQRKLEWKLQQSSMREVWSGMKTVTGFRPSKGRGGEGSEDRANDRNLFFNRFDTELSVVSLQSLAMPLSLPPPPYGTTASCERRHLSPTCHVY